MKKGSLAYWAVTNLVGGVLRITRACNDLASLLLDWRDDDG